MFTFLTFPWLSRIYEYWRIILTFFQTRSYSVLLQQTIPATSDEEQVDDSGLLKKTAIDKLPPELLAKIFAACVSNERIRFLARGAHSVSEDLADHCYYLTLKWSQTKAPFNLLQVCSTWRYVAQSAPEIWKSLSVKSWTPYRPTVLETSYWINQVGSPPLRLHLALDYYVRHGSLRQLDLLRLFSTQAHRWESLSIELDAALTQELTLILRRHQQLHGFPFLRCLYIGFTRHPLRDQSDIEDLTNAISSITNLRRLVWGAARLQGHLNFAWNQLHIIHIEAQLSIDSTLQYISQCTAATDITIKGLPENDTSTNLDITLIHLFSLKHLRLEGEHVIPLFAHFLFPALETLQICTVTWDSIAPYHILSNFLNRSGNRLRKIAVNEGNTELLPEIAKAYFSFTALASVSTVELHGGLDDWLLQMLQKEKDDILMLALPNLLAWKGKGFHGIAVGWKELNEWDTLYFSWKNGELHILKPFYTYE